MKRWLTMAVPLAAVALAGCVSGPGPLGDGGERVVREVAARPALAAPMAVPDELTLVAAKAVALANNPNLAAASWRVEQAAARLRQAQAAFGPTVDASSAWAHQEYTPRASTGGFPSEAYESYSAGLTANWLLFDGWARRFSELAARHGRDASIAALDEARRLLSLAVAQTFYAALLAGEELAISQADAQFNAELLSDTRKRMAADKASRLDELNFMVNLNNANAAVIVNEQQQTVLRSVLADLLGVADGDLPAAVKLVVEDVPVPAPNFAADLERARQRRPDRRAIMARVDAAVAGLKATRGGYLPQLAATGGYGYLGLDDYTFGENDRSASLGLAATWRLYDAGLRDAQQSEALATIRELQADLARLDRAMAADLRQNAEQIQAAQRLLTLQQETVTLTLEQRDRERQRYKAGQTTLTRLNEVQTNLVRAQGTLAVRRLGLLQQVEEYQAAVGY